MRSKERTAGFYWVNYLGVWFVAEWMTYNEEPTGPQHYWRFGVFPDICVFDGMLSLINETKLTPPNE